MKLIIEIRNQRKKIGSFEINLVQIANRPAQLVIDVKTIIRTKDRTAKP